MLRGSGFVGRCAIGSSIRRFVGFDPVRLDEPH
jgi:hypothetical protein